MTQNGSDTADARAPQDHRPARRSPVRRVLARADARVRAQLRARPWQTLEIVLGALFVLSLVRHPGVFAPFAEAIGDGVAAAGPLLRVDGAATVWLLALALGKLGLATLPSLLLIRAAPGHRRIWLVPLLALLAILSAPLSLAACATFGGWLVLGLVSAAAVALSSVRFLGWTAVLPFAVLWQVVPSHGVLNLAQVGTEDPAYREQLLSECARHDGARPPNLTADLIMPYHGINALSEDLVLLSGEGPNDGGMRGRTGGRRAGSWWLRRRDGVFRFEAPSGATGNLWRGCLLDGTIWMARANYIVGATRPLTGETAQEQVSRLQLPSADMDFGETACDPQHGRVYVTEALQGGMWEVTPLGGEARRHAIGGVVLLPKHRFDGRLVLTSTASLMVFSPVEERVSERIAAGLAIIGFDVCALDGTVAVADATGRLRVFDIDAAGHYRFAWGVSLFAPRRVAYSPDCARIAVTSADDRSVHIIAAATRRVVNTVTAGPALREVAATGPREFSITDVCSMTSYRW